MNWLYLLIGIVVGGVAAYLVLSGRRKDVLSQLALARQQLAQEQEARGSVQSQLDAAKDDNRELSAQAAQVKADLAAVKATLEVELAHNSKETQMRNEQFERQMETVREQFSNLAAQVLDRTSDKLKTTNAETFENLTRPLKQNIEQLHQAIQSTNSETAKSTASLSQQLKEMSEQTHKIDTTATRLTNVIRGGNKAQGNWGERMLTEILDAQGFVRGTDYDAQFTITDDKGNTVVNDDSGKKMIPDVVLHYPNNEDVVIDSKMSIEAYYQYVNTEDEAFKKKYADDMVKSVRAQMGGLARKDYSRYIKKPRRAIDFVIMFVPNDGALQLALATDPKLWGEAFDKQVFITGQQNLMAILKMIQIAWRQYAQTENQKRVFDMAEEMLKRVGEFVKRFDKVGKDIDMLRTDYSDAYNKAHTGRQSIVQKANELKELGVKESANQPIPETEPDLINE